MGRPKSTAPTLSSQLEQSQGPAWPGGPAPGAPPLTYWTRPTYLRPSAAISAPVTAGIRCLHQVFGYPRHGDLEALAVDCHPAADREEYEFAVGDQQEEPRLPLQRDR